MRSPRTSGRSSATCRLPGRRSERASSTTWRSSSGAPAPPRTSRAPAKRFSVALAHFDEHEESGWHARVLHNFATSLSNLGETASDLSESVALFERALDWRTTEREIARGVTLHNMGIALRRLARLVTSGGAGELERSAAALDEAAEIRSRHGLAEGHALSLFHLGLTLDALERQEEARKHFLQAGEEFEQLGKLDSAAIARERAAGSAKP